MSDPDPRDAWIREMAERHDAAREDWSYLAEYRSLSPSGIVWRILTQNLWRVRAVREDGLGNLQWDRSRVGMAESPYERMRRMYPRRCA